MFLISPQFILINSLRLNLISAYMFLNIKHVKNINIFLIGIKNYSGNSNTFYLSIYLSNIEKPKPYSF